MSLGFTGQEKARLRRLNTPAKVQDFLNSIPFNFEPKGDTIKSPLRVLQTRSAHCFEGALLGAYILSLHGHQPLLLHLEAKKNGKVKDWDHIVVPFQEDGLWGALSKTNHAVLRYREPVYKNIRELVMSYFHEYFTDDGKKTLRRYSVPLNLNVFEEGWEIEQDDLWGIDEQLDRIKHFDIMPKTRLAKLRLADQIECDVGKIVEYETSSTIFHL